MKKKQTPTQGSTEENQTYKLAAKTSLTKEMMAASSSIFTSKSSNCSIINLHSGLPATHQQTHIKHTQENPAVAREATLQLLYSSCCDTYLQGHPRSMISISSERVYTTFY